MSSSDSSAVPPGSMANLFHRPLSPDDFVVLNDEIRAFVRAGIPLDVGLRGTAERSFGELRAVCESLSRRLEQGASVEEAIAAEESRLPSAYRAIVTAGLRTGRIDQVMASLSELAASTTSLRRELRLSMIYPAVVFAMAYSLFVAFLFFVVPQIERTYSIFEMEESVWLVTARGLHRTMSIWGILVPGVIAAVVLVGWLKRRFVSGLGGGSVLSGWIPGGRDVALARFARVFSLLVGHGVPLPEACALSGDAAGDKRVHQASRRLANAVEAGESLSIAMQSATQLPPFLRWIIVAGEHQGSLSDSLRHAADVYEQRALTRLDWFRRVVPPLTVAICCGSITLLYGLTLFLPLTEMIRKLGLG